MPPPKRRTLPEGSAHRIAGRQINPRNGSSSARQLLVVDLHDDGADLGDALAIKLGRQAAIRIADGASAHLRGAA